jgi:integrase
MRNEEPITFAQRLLGHATVEMTARVYTHLDEQSLRGAIDRIEMAMPASERAKAMTA